jgi:hypothetical protein
MMLFWFTIISAALGVLFTVFPIVAELWRKDEDGKGRPTRSGRFFFSAAGASFLVGIASTRLQDKEATRERAVADSISLARTNVLTARLTGMLREMQNLRDESTYLRGLQIQALGQVDSLSASSAILVEQQQFAIQDLRTSLAMAASISDSLQASVALSRDIAGTLQDAETQAAERTRQTLARIERSQNPLTSLRAEVKMYLPGGSSLQADALLRALGGSTSTDGESNRSRLAQGILGKIGDRTVRFGFPETIDLRIWPGPTECPVQDNDRAPIFARRDINYDSAEVELFYDQGRTAVFGLQIDLAEGDFVLSSVREISVEDLREACIHFTFYGYAGWEGAGFWDELGISLSRVLFPQGRRGEVGFDPVYDRSGRRRTGWAGRLKLDSEGR